jgi:hypothetical protein
VPFVVDLISQWTKGPSDGAGSYRINDDTWMVSTGGPHPMAAELFRQLNESPAAAFFTSDRESWSYWFTGAGQTTSNGNLLRKWIEQGHPEAVVLSEDPWQVWTTEHAEKLRGPFPSKGSIWKLPRSKESR